MPEVSQQRGPASASRLGLQPRQLHANAGPAEGSGALVHDDVAGEADQDRRENRPPRRLRHLPDGRGRHLSRPVRRHPAPHRPAQTADNVNMTNELPLMLADDGIGVSGMRPERRFPRPPQPIGSPFHDIAKTVVVKRDLVARREILRHAQPGRRISPGESRISEYNPEPKFRSRKPSH